MTRGDEVQRPIPVVCRLCGTRMYARAADLGKSVRCPDCETLTEIRLPPPPKKPVEPRDVGQYQLAESGWGSTGKQQADEPVMIVKCPVCATRLSPRREQAGKPVRCPDCDSRFRLPEWQPQVRRTIEPAQVEAIPIGEAHRRPPPPKPTLTHDDELRQVPSADPPQILFLSTVWTFPFSGGALPRWLGVAGGTLVVSLLLWAAFTAVEALGDFAIIGGGALVFAAIWPLLWTVSFASACGLTIIEETASGADVIEGWTDSDWRQWIFPMLIVGLHVFLASAIASILFRAFYGWFVGAPFVWLAALHLSFPLTLLSALEVGSPAGFYSAPVWNSLVRQLKVWLAFFAIVGLLGIVSAAPFGGLWVLAYYVPETQRFAAISAWLYVVVIWPAVWFIYARLLGRLAWRITQDTEGDDSPDEQAEEETPRWRHPAIRAGEGSSSD